MSNTRHATLLTTVAAVLLVLLPFLWLRALPAAGGWGLADLWLQVVFPSVWLLALAGFAAYSLWTLHRVAPEQAQGEEIGADDLPERQGRARLRLVR